MASWVLGAEKLKKQNGAHFDQARHRSVELPADDYGAENIAGRWWTKDCAIVFGWGLPQHKIWYPRVGSWEITENATPAFATIMVFYSLMKATKSLFVWTCERAIDLVANWLCRSKRPTDAPIDLCSLASVWSAPRTMTRVSYLSHRL